MDEIQFEVGGKYENMKGVFEVIAIRRDSMDIRWESGEEISTPIELQQRIIEIMQHEKEMEEDASYIVGTDPLANQYNQKQALQKIARRLAKRIYLKTMERF